MTLTYPRVTCGWKTGLAKTFRNTSSKLLDIYGTNLQNPAKSTIEIYEADPGCSLVQPDQAGAEALVVAYLCKPGNFRELFIQEVKPHTYVAMHIFHEHWAKELSLPNIDDFLSCAIRELKDKLLWKSLAKLIKDHDKYYFIGKKTCHSSNYCMKAPTFQMDVLKESEGKIVLSRAEAELFLDTYHNLFPEIKIWQAEIIKAISNFPRTIFNLFGHPRECYDNPLAGETQRDFTSWAPQSTVGCISNIAITNMRRFIFERRKNWLLLNNKHDSMLLQCPDAEVGECCAKSQEFMEQELKSPRGEEFRMRSEVSVGKNWGKKSKENPDGMEEYKAA